MKSKLSEIAPGSCFMHRNRMNKKLSDGRVITVGKAGKPRTRTLKGDPEVDVRSCDLNLIGAGSRKHPESVIEIGNGRPRHVSSRKLKGR